MVLEAADVREAVRGWLREHVTGSTAVGDADDLIGMGLLTSLQTLELVLFLEERFGISVSEDEFIEDNFRSIEAIAALVAAKRG
jgi:acyl carrier protein